MTALWNGVQSSVGVAGGLCFRLCAQTLEALSRAQGEVFAADVFAKNAVALNLFQGLELRARPSQQSVRRALDSFQSGLRGPL